jgi:adenylate cyclase
MQQVVIAIGSRFANSASSLQGTILPLVFVNPRFRWPRSSARRATGEPRINVGDIIIEDEDIFGDGVNIAARLEALAEPGGICISARVEEDVHGKLDTVFEDIGEKQLKNIARPVRVYRARLGGKVNAPAHPILSLPDKPSIVVLPFQNMSGDPEQEYFADGVVEEITTALSRFKTVFVIARNSSFTYKGKAVDVKQIGRDLGVRYALEGSVRKAAASWHFEQRATPTRCPGGCHIWPLRTLI